MTVQRVVGRVEVEHDLFGRRPVRLDKRVDQQRIQRFAARDHFLVPVAGRRLGLPQLQTVQRARHRRRMTAAALTHPSFPPHVFALQRQRQHAVVAKPVVIVEILVAQSQPIHPLPNERLHSRDPTTEPATIEHILPQNPSQDWFDSFTALEVEAATSRIGNMTLLESAVNREVGSAPYAEKCAAYEGSDYALTREVAEIAPEEWTFALMENRSGVWHGAPRNYGAPILSDEFLPDAVRTPI